MSEGGARGSGEIPPQGQGRRFAFGRDMRLADVYFGFDRHSLTSEARQAVRANAELLKQNPTTRIQVQGHADERGTAEYNLALGDRRAETVRKFLASLGVSPRRVFTISYGEERPADPEHNESAWSLNRRAQFLVSQ